MHVNYLLRNLCTGQEATVRTRYGTDWFQIAKGIQQGWILSPCLFNFYAEHIMWNDGLDEAQAGIKTARRNINNLINADDTTLMAENEEELKSLLRRVKEESENVGWKLNIQKMKIMASGSITSWQTEGEKVEAVTDYFLGLQNHCRQWLQPWNKKMILVRKAMTNPDSVLNGRDITLTTKVCISQSCGFSSSQVWMWEFNDKAGWVLKNRCFWTVVLERTPERPLDCKEIKPVNPKGNQPWIFSGRTHAKAEAFNTLATSCKELPQWKRLTLGETEGKRRRWRQRMRWLDSITDSMDMNLSKL